MLISFLFKLVSWAELLYASDKEKELQRGSFSSGNLDRCLSDVPRAVVVVVRHQKQAGRVVFTTYSIKNRVVNLVVNKKLAFLF